jgi:hypothetical protein
MHIGGRRDDGPSGHKRRAGGPRACRAAVERGVLGAQERSKRVVCAASTMRGGSCQEEAGRVLHKTPGSMLLGRGAATSVHGRAVVACAFEG